MLLATNTVASGPSKIPSRSEYAQFMNEEGTKIPNIDMTLSNQKQEASHPTTKQDKKKPGDNKSDPKRSTQRTQSGENRTHGSQFK